MSHHPTFNGATCGWSAWIRQCWNCGRRIGRYNRSFVYGKGLTICRRCHVRANKPGCEHRIRLAPGKPWRRGIEPMVMILEKGNTL